MQLLVATSNQHKLKEVRALLSDLDWEILGLSDLPHSFGEAEETGDTFQENAGLKAHYYGDQAQLLTLAEDSGLMVSALGGAPGVQSHRFAGGSDTDRCHEILRLLESNHDRSARFIAVICLYNPTTGEEHFFEGQVVGSIAEQLQGESGFGYDPIFIPAGYEQSFAELGETIKNSISHRRQALEKVKAYVLSTTQRSVA